MPILITFKNTHSSKLERLRDCWKCLTVTLSQCVADSKRGRHGRSGGAPKTPAMPYEANSRNQTWYKISSSPVTSGVSFGPCNLCLVTLFLKSYQAVEARPVIRPEWKDCFGDFLLNMSSSHWGKQSRNTDSAALISSADHQGRQSLQQICLKYQTWID